MKIIWGESEHVIHKKFGSNLTGLQHKGKRPDTIVLTLDEMFNHYQFIESLARYLYMLMKINPNIVITIGREDS